jgi:hypothetical protein
MFEPMDVAEPYTITVDGGRRTSLGFGVQSFIGRRRRSGVSMRAAESTTRGSLTDAGLVREDVVQDGL